MTLLLLFLQLVTPDTNAQCIPFNGGPADGMCPGAVVASGKDFQLVELLPANRGGAPIIPQVSSTLSAILNHQQTADPIDPNLLANDATAEFCEKFSNECFSSEPLQAWPVGKDFVPNAPYGLADGRVRIEWMRNGRLEFLSFITFEGAKVKDVSTAPAEMPVKTSP